MQNAMQSASMTDNSLQLLRVQLDKAGATEEDYVLFGSTVLYFHGLRDSVGDVDVFVKPYVWYAWNESEEWEEQWPDPDDPPLLEYNSKPPIHAFYDWAKKAPWMNLERCFATAESVNGWQCIPLDEVKTQKEGAMRRGLKARKHKRDLKKIDKLTRS